jgi:hypothetical protein
MIWYKWLGSPWVVATATGQVTSRCRQQRFCTKSGRQCRTEKGSESFSANAVRSLSFCALKLQAAQKGTKLKSPNDAVCAIPDADSA